MTSCHNISKKIPLGYYVKWDSLLYIFLFYSGCTFRFLGFQICLDSRKFRVKCFPFCLKIRVFPLLIQKIIEVCH